MSTELVTQPQGNPFQKAALAGGNGMNVGAVSIEQERAIAEAQGQLVLAKKFPRDLNSAHTELMTACKSKAFAEQAFYAVPNRGSGPSIRFAEEIARVVGNFEFGHRELSRSEGKSEIEVYAWDKEKNNLAKRQITVLHVTDTKSGPKPLRDQADIDNKIANVASKQSRGRILALMPKWLVADAIEECKKTLAGTNEEPLEARVRKMATAFLKYGVTTEHLEKHLKHKLDQILLDELVDLVGIFNAIKAGAKASDYFGAEDKQIDSESTATLITQTAQQGAKAIAAEKATAAEKVVTEQPAAEKSANKAAPANKSNKQQKNSNPVEAESAADKPETTQQETAPVETEAAAAQQEPETAPEPQPANVAEANEPEPAKSDAAPADDEDLF